MSANLICVLSFCPTMVVDYRDRWSPGLHFQTCTTRASVFAFLTRLGASTCTEPLHGSSSGTSPSKLTANCFAAVDARNRAVCFAVQINSIARFTCRSSVSTLSTVSFTSAGKITRDGVEFSRAPKLYAVRFLERTLLLPRLPPAAKFTVNYRLVVPVPARFTIQKEE